MPAYSLLVCEKNEENATKAPSFHDEEFKEWASDYAISRPMRNGNIEGNRYYMEKKVLFHSQMKWK